MATHTSHSRSRGGGISAPIHLSQMLLATILLIAAPILLVGHQWVAGFAAMLAGMVLSVHQFRA